MRIGGRGGRRRRTSSSGSSTWWRRSSTWIPPTFAAKTSSRPTSFRTRPPRGWPTTAEHTVRPSTKRSPPWTTGASARSRSADRGTASIWASGSAPTWRSAGWGRRPWWARPASRADCGRAPWCGCTRPPKRPSSPGRRRTGRVRRPRSPRSWPPYLAWNLPPAVEPALAASAFYDPTNFTFPFGSPVAVVEVDAETGQVALKRYVAVDDCGRVINPLIVDGQVHGGLVQGIAQALYEGAAYDPDGQLITSTMADYAVPKAHMFPTFETGRTETPSPHNPLGVKGVGETGTIA